MSNPNHITTPNMPATRRASIGSAMVAADRLVGLLGSIDKNDGSEVSTEQFIELQTRLAALSLKITNLQLLLSPDIARPTDVEDIDGATIEEFSAPTEVFVPLTQDFARTADVRY